MIDRQSVKVVETPLGLALRYAEYTESGQFVAHRYMILDDEATEAGTFLGKANLLSDPVSQAIFGNATDHTVNEALAVINTTAISGNNTNGIYATCYTAAATVAKVVTLPNAKWQRTVGAVLAVSFPYAVPANATLNVNGTGAAQLRIGSSRIAAGDINAGDTAWMVWVGTDWYVLAVDRSATGRSKPFIVGTYTGNDATSRTINTVDDDGKMFTPKIVIIGNRYDYGSTAFVTSDLPTTGSAYITTNGFVVKSSFNYTSTSFNPYRYAAFR